MENQESQMRFGWRPRGGASDGDIIYGGL